jgi:DNA-directed RNA polymerase specialized sigma24 family protein
VEFGQFRRIWGKKLLYYVGRYSARIGAGPEARRDLEQTAWVAAWVSLKGWKADGGRNPFQWVAPSVRTAMWREWRKMNGQRGRGSVWVSPARFEPVGAATLVDEGYERVADVLDLRRVCSTYPRPQALVRFVMLALSPASGADLGRTVGVSRRYISAQRRTVRAELAGAMG